MEVLFCDNHLLVAIKPSGIPTQGEEGLEQLAKEFLKKKFQKKGNVFLEPIHRLDKPVSGIVLFARTSKALSRLQEMMRQKKIAKTYLAYIEGVPSQKEGFLEHFLLHDDHYAKVVSSSTPKAKKAILHYKILQTEKNISLVEVQLLTGRYHQIRAQFSAIGCPIVGDSKYGSSNTLEKGRIGLRATKLEFTHPVTKEPLLFHLEKNL